MDDDELKDVIKSNTLVISNHTFSDVIGMDEVVEVLRSVCLSHRYGL